MTAAELTALKSRFSKRELWDMSKDAIIDDVAKAVGSKPFFDKQDQILHNDKRYTIIKSGRNTAKSYNAAFIVYCLLWFGGYFQYEMHITLAGPRAEDTKNIFEKLFGEEIPIRGLGSLFDGMKIVSDNWLSRLTDKKKVYFANGSWVVSASCDNPKMDDFRGPWRDLIIIDEFGNVKYKDLAVAALQYSLNREEPLNLAWLIGTPEDGVSREFTRLFELGQNENSEYVKSFHIAEVESPYRDEEATSVAAEILSIEAQMREGGGEDQPDGGRMFKDFTMNEVVDRPFDQNKPYITGVDVGFRKPVAEFMNVWFEEGDVIPYVHVFYELDPNDITIDQLVDGLDTIVKSTCQGIQPVIMGVDKAGDQVKTNAIDTDFITIHKKFHQAVKNTKGWAVDKTNQVKMLLILTKIKHLTVDPGCGKLVEALKMAGYDVNSRQEIVRAGWKKQKGYDDPLDALAYALINYGPTADLILEATTPVKGFTQQSMDAIMDNPWR